MLYGALISTMHNYMLKTGKKNLEAFIMNKELKKVLSAILAVTVAAVMVVFVFANDSAVVVNDTASEVSSEDKSEVTSETESESESQSDVETTSEKESESVAPLNNGILGDADQNGVVNAIDARITLRISARLETLENVSVYSLIDINADGSISAMDARAILRASARLEKLTQPEDFTDDNPNYVIPKE